LAEARPELAARLGAIDRRARIEERRSRYFLAPRADRKETFADGFVGRLGGDLGALPARLADMAWSPSRLEALGACGFKFFARYLLGLGEDRDPETEVGRLERGTLVHAVLEGLYRDGLPADLETARATARRFLAEARPRYTRAILAKDPALFGVTWAQIAAVVDELIVLEHAERTELGAAGIEVEHVLEEALEFPLADASGGVLTLVGTPDRIDVRRRGDEVIGVRVVDYKMSKTATRYTALLDPEKQLGKTGFQIPVYLLGALAKLGRVAPEAVLEGGYVVLLADQKHHLRMLTREQLGAEGASGRIVELVARASAGRFDVDPEPCDEFCAYRAVCRYQRPPLEEEQ
jgi:RecB family exonuclease